MVDHEDQEVEAQARAYQIHRYGHVLSKAELDAVMGRCPKCNADYKTPCEHTEYPPGMKISVVCDFAGCGREFSGYGKQVFNYLNNHKQIHNRLPPKPVGRPRKSQ